MILSFLPLFNLKERHYNIPPTNACNPFQTLPSSTTAGVVEKLELVVTPFSKFMLTSDFKDELKLCFTNLTPTHPKTQGLFSILLPFSISKLSSFFTFISQQPLSILNILPSILHKTQGRRLK